MLYSIVKYRLADETIQGRKIPKRHKPPAEGQKWPVLGRQPATCRINRLGSRSAWLLEYFSQRHRDRCFGSRVVEQVSGSGTPQVLLGVDADAVAAFSRDARWRDARLVRNR